MDNTAPSYPDENGEQNPKPGAFAKVAHGVGDVMHSNTLAFAGGAFMGGLQGAFYGGIAWTALFVAEVVSGGAALAVIAGVGAAVFALAKGIKAVADNNVRYPAHHHHPERSGQSPMGESRLAQREEAHDQEREGEYSRFVARESERRERREERREFRGGRGGGRH